MIGAGSSQPWLEDGDQDLSGSSCECTDTSTGSRRSRRSRRPARQPRHNNNNNNNQQQGNNTVTKAQCHGGASPVSSRESNCSPGLNSAYRAMVSLAGNRTPSIEQSSVCLTETTDCPSDISVITSISALPGQPAAARDTADLLAARLGGFSVSGSSEAPDVVPAAEVVPRAAAADSARVTLPPVHLRAMVRDRLRAEGISLSSHPYTQVSIIQTCKRCLTE